MLAHGQGSRVPIARAADSFLGAEPARADSRDGLRTLARGPTFRRMPNPSLYDTDIVTWADRQVAELRRLADAGVSNAVDWANVIEEIECVGRSEWKGVRSQVGNALAHIVKGLCEPGSLSRVGWAAETSNFLAEARSDYRPSMRPLLDIDEIWRDGFRRATDSLKPYRVLIPPRLPRTSPFTLDEILAESFSYDEAVLKLQILTSGGDQDDRR